jgi:hypothetical protein
MEEKTTWELRLKISINLAFLLPLAYLCEDRKFSSLVK